VDISAFRAEYDLHTHAVNGNTGNTTPTLSGHSSGWAFYGESRVDGTNPTRNVGGTIIFLRTYASAADANNDVNATGETAYIGSTQHGHELDGDGQGTGLAGTGVSSSHLHAAGTLDTAVP